MKTPNEHQQYLLEEFVEEYQQRRMSRRELLRRSLLATGSLAVTASTLLVLGCGSDDDDEPALQTGGAASPEATAPEASTTEPTTAPAPSPTEEATSGEDEVEAADITIPGPASELFAYLARPAAEGAYPALLVIHENRGLLPHFKDVSRRYAAEGFVALAVDLASRRGGTEVAADQLGQIPPEDLVADLQAGLDYLKAQDFVNADALGVTGFCFGGGYTFDMAASSPDVKAAVPYYGTARRAINNGLAETTAAVFVVYGETDTRITSERDEVESVLSQNSAPYQIVVYEDAAHAFFNDTGGRYHPEAANSAWAATLDWFRLHLSG